MKTIILGMLIILFSASVLLAQHPRLYFTQNDLPRVRAAEFQADQYLGETEFTYKYYGGKEVAFALPPVQPGTLEEPPGFDYERFGHYPYWTMMSRQIQNRLQLLSLAYASTGREEFARTAIDYALSLAKWNVWTDLDYSKRTCLDTCHLTMGVAAVYDMCYDRMSEDERTAIQDGMVKLGLEFIMEDIGERSEHNLQMLRASALGIGGAAVLGEVPKAEVYVAAARDYYTWWLNGRLTSKNTEGLGYTSYGMENCMGFASVLYRAAGDDSLMTHPAVDMIKRWMIYFQGPGGTGGVNFSDGSIANFFPNTMKVLNNSLDCGYAGWYLEKSRYTDGKDWSGIIYGNTDRKVTPPTDWSDSAVFRNIGWSALRSGWEDSDVLFAFLSSDSRMGHNHRDANHFVLNRAGEWLITDPGYKSFDGGNITFYGLNTVGHNSILVDGEGQDKLGGGKIVSFSTTPLFDFTAGDASGSYDPAKLSKFTRKIAFVKPDYFVMLDQVASEGSPRKFEWLVRTDKAGTYRIDGRIGEVGREEVGRRINISKERSEVTLHGLLPVDRTANLTYYEDVEAYAPHIAVAPKEKSPMATFLTLIAPTPKDLPDNMNFRAIEESGVVGMTGRFNTFNDTVLFRSKGGRVSFEGVKFLGESCFLRQENGKLITAALANGRTLEVEGRMLIMLSRDGSVALEFGETLTAHAYIEGQTDVRISIPSEPRTVEVGGSPADLRFEADSSMIMLTLPEGNHTIKVQ